jgi:hypothetical protein
MADSRRAFHAARPAQFVAGTAISLDTFSPIATARSPLMRRAAYLTTLLAAAALILTACGGPGTGPTITSAEAATRVDAHIHEVAAAIPGARLQLQSPMAITMCNAPVDGGPLGRVAASASYRVVGYPPDQNAAAFDLAQHYWTDHGYRILHDARPQDAYLWAEAPDPDFTTIALEESGNGTHVLFLVSSSPCVWPEGIPKG